MTLPIRRMLLLLEGKGVSKKKKDVKADVNHYREVRGDDHRVV